METVARRRVKPLAILAAVIGVYWLAMFGATHMPIPPTPSNDPYSLDKLQHLTAFAIFGVLLCVAGSFLGWPRLLLFLGVIIFIAAYAAFDELSQQYVTDRTPDFFDWLADIGGALLGIVAFAIVERLYFNRQRRSGSMSEPAA